MMHLYLPVVVLFFSSFVIGEMLLGASTVSRLAAAIPVVFFYGGGAVVIRELARRRGPGWWRIVMLGLAYGIFEEGVVILSLFNPDLFKAGLVGGRALGVNWVWSEWVVGYHAVFSILIPIFLAELLFPDRRREPWLGRKGLAALTILFGLSAIVIGLVFRKMIAPDFRPPLPQFLSACTMAAGLAAVAIALPSADHDRARPRTLGPTPAPWLVGLLGLCVSASWFGLLMLPEPLKAGAWPLAPIGATLAIACATVFAVDNWSRRGPSWTIPHRIAMVLGALPPIMLFGSLVVTTESRVDQIGQGIISVGVYVALIGLMIDRRRNDETADREQVATGGSDVAGLEKRGTHVRIKGR